MYITKVSVKMQMDDCIFCKIVKGDIPSARIWEDEKFLVFHDTFPIKMGHTLVIPKEHYPYVFGLDDKLFCDLMLTSKFISKILLDVYKPKTGKIGVMIAGEEVNHAHLHLIPMNNGSDLNFANSQKDLDFKIILKEVEKIKKAIR